MNSSDRLRHFQMEFRVNYHETDGQLRVHNSHYLNYFERGRVELLRAAGISYRDLEGEGWMLVVRNVQVTYHSPASFDDLLLLSLTTLQSRGARILTAYKIHREEQLIVTGQTEVACLNREGRVCRLPPQLQLENR